MVEKSSFTTKKRSGRGDSELDWGNASHPWSNEIATSTNLGMLNGNPTVPQKPVADASVDIDNGNRSTEFTFDASGTTDPQDSTLTYEWVFGDGTTTSTQQATVVHTFDTKGTYTVELTATNELGESDTDTVQVNYPALLGLSASLRTGLPVSKTRFAGTESIPVGSAVSAGIESG